jgi:hypothetical protein
LWDRWRGMRQPHGWADRFARQVEKMVREAVQCQNIVKGLHILPIHSRELGVLEKQMALGMTPRMRV